MMEHCKGGDLFKTLMMKGGTLDEQWVCTEVTTNHQLRHLQLGVFNYSNARINSAGRVCAKSAFQELLLMLCRS